MQDLSGEFGHQKVRQRVGEKLLALLDADYFASYVWDEAQQRFVSGVNINMSEDNLKSYEEYYQFHDPITPILQRRRKATAVSHIMEHNRLVKTEFFNDFLAKDGLHYGMNFFAYDRCDNIGDLRIWRCAGKQDFCERDEKIVDAIAPSLVNALMRANARTQFTQYHFMSIRDEFHLTNREAEIADLVVTGMSDVDICLALHISKATLRTHISSIFNKTNTQRRSQLAHLLHSKNHH